MVLLFPALNTSCIDMTDYTPLPTAPPPQHAQHVNPPAYSAGPESMPQSYGSTNHPGYQGGVGYQQQPPYTTPSSYQPAPVYNTSNTTVVQTQPNNLPTYRPPKPSSYIWLSVITMLCCCFVLGLVALIIGLEVDTAYNTGDDARAREKSKRALGFSVAALATGVVIHLSWIAPVVYLFAFVYTYN